MAEVFEVSWQGFAAILLMAAGAVLGMLGLWREWDGIRRPIKDPAKVLTWARGFRLSLLVLALAIGGEETLESTIFVFALTRGKDLRLGPSNKNSVTSNT